MEIKVNALVLKAVDYNENDKLLTLLTAENGKITAGIKGVKKAAAKLKFAAQPFCFAEYVLTRRGDRYTVIGAYENESFYDLRTDAEKFYAAAAACEIAEQLVYDGEDCREIFVAAVRALSEICSGSSSVALIKFLICVLQRAGYGVSLNGCSACGKNLSNEDKMRFDMKLGAFTCFDCGGGAGASKVTYHVLRNALNLPCEKQFLTPDGEKRALKLLKSYLCYKTDCQTNCLAEYIKLI